MGIWEAGLQVRGVPDRCAQTLPRQATGQVSRLLDALGHHCGTSSINVYDRFEIKQKRFSGLCIDVCYAYGRGFTS